MTAKTRKKPAQKAESPTSSAALLRQAKERLAEALSHKGSTGPSELAAVIRALNELQEREAAQAMADRVKIIYYLPEKEIRPEDLLEKKPDEPAK